MSAVDLLKGCPLFYELYDNEIDAIIGSCLVAQFEKGEHIISQGEEGSEIFILLHGRADVVVEKNGQLSPVASVKKGDVFGELVLINQLERTANIIASEPCDVLIVNYEHIYELYDKKTKIFSILILNLARMLTKRLQRSNETMEKMISGQDEKKAA